MERTAHVARDDSQQSERFKCAACFKQFKKKQFLAEHIDRAGHSLHEPCCGCCRKHCKCFDALREHLLGALAKLECAKEFAERGCKLCLDFLDSPESLAAHRAKCQLVAGPPSNIATTIVVSKRVQAANDHCDSELESHINTAGGKGHVVALDCEMVGGGQDGSFDLCARICVVDEHENILLHTYVKPQLPITDYRYEITSIREEDLIDAMPVKTVRETVEAILYNGAKSWRNRKNVNLLVGHSLHHDLNCLGMDYPAHLIRDTAYYPPLLKTSNVSNKLQYLAKTYLGYQIQEGDCHDPYEDAVAALRLYKRMRLVGHQCSEAPASKQRQSPAPRKREDFEELNRDALLELSVPRYQCWCSDSHLDFQEEHFYQ